jgi:hypothetical protein
MGISPREHWYYDKDGKDLCKKCYMKSYMQDYGKKLFSFKGHYKIAQEIIRKGLCSWCKNKLDGVTTKRTSLHHIKYDENYPLKHTVEICNRCHSKLKRKHPEVKRICFDCHSETTRLEKTKANNLSEHWYFLNLDLDQYLCNKCYCRRKKERNKLTYN